MRATRRLIDRGRLHSVFVNHVQYTSLIIPLTLFQRLQSGREAWWRWLLVDMGSSLALRQAVLWIGFLIAEFSGHKIMYDSYPLNTFYRFSPDCVTLVQTGI